MSATENQLPDAVIVTGISKYLDGEYEFDVKGLLTLGHDDCLTNREIHRVKVMSGVRFGELGEALGAGDNDVLVALSAVVLTRAGKRYDDETLWDSTVGAVTMRVSPDTEEETEEDLTPLPDAPETSSERSSATN